MAVPKLKKISINMGVGEASQDKGKIEGAVNDLKMISGQQPVITKARKSVAGFKLREGVNVGVKVTLRKDKMYEFFDRLVTAALPRVRDFQGVKADGFDDAVIGVCHLSRRLIYSYAKCIEILVVEEGMEVIDAIEHLSYNLWSSGLFLCILSVVYIEELLLYILFLGILFSQGCP